MRILQNLSMRIMSKRAWMGISHMASCIIGVAFGLQKDALTVFVKSARRYWNCDIIIVGDNLSDDALSFLKENNVIWDGGHEKPSRFFMGRWQFYPPHLEQYDMAL